MRVLALKKIKITRNEGRLRDFICSFVAQAYCRIYFFFALPCLFLALLKEIENHWIVVRNQSFFFCSEIYFMCFNQINLNKNIRPRVWLNFKRPRKFEVVISEIFQMLFFLNSPFFKKISDIFYNAPITISKISYFFNRQNCLLFFVVDPTYTKVKHPHTKPHIFI